MSSDDLTVDMPPVNTTDAVVFTEESWRAVAQRMTDLRAENAALRERLERYGQVINRDGEKLLALEQRERQARALLQAIVDESALTLRTDMQARAWLAGSEQRAAAQEASE